MTNWLLWNLLKEKKIISENKYYLDGRERKVSRTRKLAVVLPFIALLLFGLFFIGYTNKITPGITGKDVCLVWVGTAFCGGATIGECLAHQGCSWNPTYETCSGQYPLYETTGCGGGGGGSYCGDGYCNTRKENCDSCASDCGCASGKYCDLKDEAYSCLNAPLIAKCGDGYCDASKGEDCESCHVDCGCDYGEDCGFSGGVYSCLNTSLVNTSLISKETKCGDGFCGTGENCDGCESDCGCADGKYCDFDSKTLSYLCMNSSINCGNKICGLDENCKNCFNDCKCGFGKYCYDNKTKIYKCYDSPLIPKCGDGFCGTGEDCSSCASDCKCALGKNCGYNNVTDVYGCKSIGVKCENGFCDEEGEEETKEIEEEGEEDPCVEVKDIVERIECQEDWRCDWSMCINGRTEAYNCEDLNNCRTNKYKPAYKDCISLKSDCIPQLECREWTECQLDLLQEVVNTDEDFKGTKTRICEDKNKCLAASTETRECKIKKPASVIVYQNKLVRICSESKTVARLIPATSKHGLDIDLILSGERKLEEEVVEKPSIDWAKIRGLLPYLLYTLIFAFIIRIFILIRRKRKERVESAKAVRIIKHFISKSENARLDGEREKAERYYKKAKFYYHYLAEDEKLKVIKRLKKLENKLGQ